MFDSHDKFITKLLCLNGRFSIISLEKVKLKVEKLALLCKLAENKSAKRHKFQRHCFQCLRKLLSIIQSSSRSQLQLLSPHKIISCSVKILSLYDDCWFYRTEIRWKVLWKYQVAMVCYRILLKTFAPVKPDETADAVFDSIIEEKIWKIEDLCEAIITDMLKMSIPGSIIAAKLSDKIEANISQADIVVNMIGLLEHFLNIYSWSANAGTDTFIERLLSLYHKILLESDEDSNAVKRGLEAGIQNLIKRLENSSLLTVVRYMCQWIVNHRDVNDDVVLNYGSLIEYAARRHQTTFLSKTLTPEIFPLVLRLIASSKRLISLLGNRVLQCLIDRNKNQMYFSTPKIFLQDENYDIKISKCLHEDKLFVKSHREVIHDSIMKSIVNHASTCLNLEKSYCTVCLIAVEIPCGFTCAALVCLVMNMQNLLLEEQETPNETAFHVHATIASIMSLLCHIHQAKVFYDYVNKIVFKRAHWAPHLNPPLQVTYEHAAHHVLWNKPDLFFVDWEVRYGLWKKFRLTNDERKLDDDTN